jgi:ribose transport system substrate-binding protein
MQQFPSAGPAGQHRRGRRPVRWMVMIAALAALSFVVAACGSSSDASSGSGGSTTASSSTTAAASSGSDAVATAKTFLAKYAATPTGIGSTTALKSKPKAGTNIVFLGTNDPNNVLIQKKVKELSQAVGFNFSLVSYDPAKPNTFQSAIDTALTKKANYLMEAGLPLTPAQLKQVKDAGAKWILDAVAGVPVQDPVLVNLAGPKIDALMGQILANFFIADSGGKGKAIMEHVPSYPILGAFSDAFEKTVKDGCPDCSVSRVDVTLPQLAAGKVPSLMVSALRKSPDTNYLVFDVGPFATGVTAALKGAGLQDKVKIIGEAADEGAIAALKDGSNTAWTAYDSVFTAYQAIYAIGLDQEGATVPVDELEVVPTQLLTKDTVPADNRWSEPKDAAAQWKALGVG